MAKRTRDPYSRQRIVEAGWRAIAALGLNGATVRAIAAEAGVSTGYVTHYFDDKAQLVQTVLDHNNLRAGMRVAEATAGTRGIDALVAAAEALLPLDADRRTEWQVWAAFWASATDGAPALAGASSALGDIIGAALVDAVADGELPAGLDRRYETERLVAVIAGIGLMAGATPTPRTRRVASRMLRDHITSLRAGAHVG